MLCLPQIFPEEFLQFTCHMAPIWFSASGYLEKSSSSSDALKLFAEVQRNEAGGEDERDGEGEGDERDEADERDTRDGEDEGSDNDDDDVGGDDRDREDGDGDGDERGEDEEDGIGGEMEAEFLDREHLKTIMAQQDPNLLRSMGHQFEDFVVYCTYRGVYCA